MKRRARQRNREQLSAAPVSYLFQPLAIEQRDRSMFHEWATSILGAVEQLTLETFVLPVLL